MALMNFNIDGVLTVEKVVVPADGILTLGHDLFRGERIIITHNGVRAARGQDFIPDRIDDRLYFQKNICLFTAIKILDESLLNEEIEVEYYACGDYIKAEIWNEYPSVASLKQSLASKVDNSDFIKEVKRIDGDINNEATARADVDNTLQDNINTETNLRIAEDEKLQTNINNEAIARADADNTLQDNINKEAAARESGDNEIRNELSSETNLRLAGDEKLQTNINNEAIARADADNTLQDNINKEAAARESGDNEIRNELSSETNLRLAEDKNLQTNINNEATARADADNTLQNNINKEAAARESADNEIRNELSSETNLRLAGDAVLQEKIDAEMSTRAESDSNLQTQISDLKTKKEEGSYIPNVYDRNANGDIPVVPFDRLANVMAVRTNRGLVSTTETEATYNEDYVGGYVFVGANDVLVKDKEMFNKIKVLVHIPGVLRIGIVNEKIYEANPRYSTCLVKWLVADFVAFTGMKEYDIADTVLEEGQSIFLECRTGVSSWYLNTGEATQVGAITYPASSCTTGLNVADKLDTTTNNALFKSQKVNSSSCLTSFGNNMYCIGGNIRGNFRERAYNSGASSTKKADENLEYFGGLNIGLYRRTKYSDTRFCKCIENAMTVTSPILNNRVRLWVATGQEALVGKSVYAIKLDVHTPGNLTICHCKGTTLNDFQIIDKYTHYVRAKGLQTIHLPFDIKLNEGEYIGIGGFHCKSTADNKVVDTCEWYYVSTNDVGNYSWMNTVHYTGYYSMLIDKTQYPEVCISKTSTGNGSLNVELICRGEKRSPLEDKYISFTGDSITTFAGFCTTRTGYPEGNPAGDNAVYYPGSGKVVNNVDATWWGILARDNRMKILRNDAWSGSRVSSTEGSTDTKCLCGTKRRYYLRNGYALATNSTYPFGRPEIIVSMIGTNDLSGNVELGEEMFKGIFGAEAEYKTILSAFSLFCRRIHDQEGNGGAKIVHFLIPRGSDYGYANANGVTIADLSLHFERIAKAWGQYFIPLSYFNGIKPNAPKRWSCPTGSMFKNTNKIEFPSADGLHPNAMGMEVIADGIHRFLCSIM